MFTFRRLSYKSRGSQDLKTDQGSKVGPSPGSSGELILKSTLSEEN